MIFQAYNLIPTLSVMDNVALPQIFINTKRKEREEKIMLLLEKLEIKDQWKKIPSELSGGQQQRIGIARAIINDPELILADEPVGNLDSQSANNVMQIISELNRSEGKTVLLVTHDQENIVWGTHIIHMKDGRIVKEEWKNQTGFSKEVKSDLEKNKSDIDKIIEKFRGITKRKTNFILDPLKANAITKSMLIPYEEKQLKIIEESVRLTLTGVYDIKKFFETMDKAIEDGGAGLDERIAKKFSLELNNLIGISKRVFGDSSNREKSLAIIEHLIKNRDIQIKGEKIEKVAVLIEKRIEEKISYVDLQKNLDLSENLGGVGLDRRTVMKILREIELILIAGIGLN